jgi:D-3-phosphoglycerate dehydrogenase
VNAEFIAEDRNLKIIKETAINNSGLTNKVSVKVSTDNGDFFIAGTVFGEKRLRIMDIDGYKLDLEPKGNLIFFRNTDVPGVIGDVGRIVSSHGLNIADFRLGRDNKSHALAVVNVDGNVTKEVLLELSKLDACISINHVSI